MTCRPLLHYYYDCIIIVVVLYTAALILRARDALFDAPGERWYVEGRKPSVVIAQHTTAPITKGVYAAPRLQIWQPGPLNLRLVL